MIGGFEEMKNKSRALTGIAGAHFVAAELSQRGYIATVTSRNTEGIDILASSPDGSKTVSIQVKTSGAMHRKSFSRSWMLTRKHEDISSDNLIYVFVDLNPGDKKPDFYVVPSKIVADYVKSGHKKWLKTPGRKGRKHVDTTMRKFDIHDEKAARKYLNRWSNLGLD